MPIGELLTSLATIAAMAIVSTSPSHAKAGTAPAEGAKYVAMGSSFAAGSGIGRIAEGSPLRCGRSAENYAQLLANARKLTLVDVTCGGATTEHLLGPWNELPPQIAAVDADTRLVTITIGGNDINYIGLLTEFSCRRVPLHPANRIFQQNCPDVVEPTERAFRELEGRLHQLAAEVRRRAPLTRLVMLQYPAMIPDRKSCDTAPLSQAEVAKVRDLGTRLARITDKVARAERFEVLRIDRMSRGHDACSQVPWVNGYPAPYRGDGIFYHPNRAGMVAQAEALERLVWGRPVHTPR